MKLLLGLFLLGFSSAAHAGAYTCAFENNKAVVKQCNIDSASPSTARCSYLFAGTNLTGTCVVVPSGSGELLACEIGVLPVAALDFSRVAQTKSATAALAALAQLPGFAAGAATLAAINKATIHLGYVEKQGAPLLSAICPPAFGEKPGK